MNRFFKDVWKAITRDPNWGGRLLLIILVIAILFLAIFLSGPKPENHMILPTPTALPAGSTNSMILPDQTSSSEYVQATGVIVAVITIVLIILIGTIIELVRNKGEDRA